MPLTIGVYPGYQEIDLEPGGTYTGSFFVVNVGEEDEPSVDYRVLSTPFSVSDDGETADYSTVTDRTRLSEWITFDVKEGVIEPNTKQEIKYTIHVPADAPVGGQYCTAAVRIGQDMEDADGVRVGSIYQVANIIYATVAGDLDYSGEILSNDITPIFLSSKINTAVTVRNTGNIHVDATSFVRIYELFGDEEVFTSENHVTTSKIIPGTTKTLTNTWQESPQLGLFRVIQTVSIGNDVSTESGIVFVAPIWFLVVWFVFITSCIFWLIFRRRARRRRSRSLGDFTGPKISR